MKKRKETQPVSEPGRILARVHAEDLQIIMGGGCSATGGGGFGDDEIVQDPTGKLIDDSFNE